MRRASCPTMEMQGPTCKHLGEKAAGDAFSQALATPP